MAANFISSGPGTWAPIETQHRRRWSLFQITKSAVVGRQHGMRPADSPCSFGGSGRLNAADTERPCREFLFQTSLLISRKAWHGTCQQAAQGRDSSALSGDMRSQWRSNAGGVLWRAARCTLLQKDGQRDGFCVSNRRNTKSLDNPSGQTAPRVHVSTTFPTVSGPHHATGQDTPQSIW